MRSTTSIFAIIAILNLGAPGSNVAQTNSPEPKLPVVAKHVCLDDNRIISHRVKRKVQMFSSLALDRVLTDTLHPGEKVSVLAGASLTIQPDRIVATQAIPDLTLQPGDTILRYAYYGEGEADIWVKGMWHYRYDLPTVKEKDGTGCQSICDAAVIENGVHEWWVQVRTPAGQTGWVLASKVSNGNSSSDGNFAGLCTD